MPTIFDSENMNVKAHEQHLIHNNKRNNTPSKKTKPKQLYTIMYGVRKTYGHWVEYMHAG